MIDGKLIKLRVFEEKQMVNKKVVVVYYAIGMFDMGLGKDPVLQLSAVAKKSKLVKGDLSDMPELPPTEYGITQMQMTAAARRRIKSATPVEMRSFLRGSFIQLQAITQKHELGT